MEGRKNSTEFGVIKRVMNDTSETLPRTGQEIRAKENG